MPVQITRSRAYRTPCLLNAAVLAATLWSPAGVCAATQDPGMSMFSVNGFGTLGMVHSSENNADFIGNFFQPNGAGFTHRWSAGVDSKFGLQIDAHFNDRFSATVQVASQHRYDNSYKPQIEWANIKYQLTPDVSVRLGRTVASLFMVSDSGLVSYTYPWVRPPLELYGELPISYKDGVDATYRSHIGTVTNSLAASYGQYTAKLAGGSEGKGSHFFDISETLERGPGSVRVAYSSLRIHLQSPNLDALFGGFTQFGQALSAIPGLQASGAQALSLADKYRLNDVPYSIITVGANYDPGTWLLMAEWAKQRSSAAISNATAWYVTGAYRWAKFTPYLTFAQVKAERRSDPGIATVGLPPQLARTASDLNGGLNALLGAFAATQKTVSAGIRWDFMRRADLKLQYDRVRTGSESSGLLTNVQPGFQPGASFNVFSTTVDFVF